MLIETLPLSSFVPVKLTYKYNSTEELKADYRTLNSGFNYYKHNILENFKDIALSKQSALVLTGIKELSSVFESKLHNITLGEMPG